MLQAGRGERAPGKGLPSSRPTVARAILFVHMTSFWILDEGETAGSRKMMNFPDFPDQKSSVDVARLKSFCTFVSVVGINDC